MSEPTTVFNNLYDYLSWELMQKGCLRYNDDISNAEVFDFVSELNWVCSNTKVDPIEVVFSSGGGGIYAALGMYDAIKSCGRATAFTFTGLVASAAAMIVLQAATRRRAHRNTRFLLHEPSRWIFMGVEKASTLRDEAEEMERLVAIIIGILVKRCGKSTVEVRHTIERKEVWMSAQEALVWGLIDEIV